MQKPELDIYKLLFNALSSDMEGRIEKKLTGEYTITESLDLFSKLIYYAGYVCASVCVCVCVC